MSHRTKSEYRAAIWGRYQRVGRRFGTRILDEFCAICGYARKYALRLLNRPLSGPPRRAGPKARYQGEVVRVLKAIWSQSEWMCSLRSWWSMRRGKISSCPQTSWIKRSNRTAAGARGSPRRSAGDNSLCRRASARFGGFAFALCAGQILQLRLTHRFAHALGRSFQG
jgi:hypothetical protein